MGVRKRSGLTGAPAVKDLFASILPCMSGQIVSSATTAVLAGDLKLSTDAQLIKAVSPDVFSTVRVSL